MFLVFKNMYMDKSNHNEVNYYNNIKVIIKQNK